MDQGYDQAVAWLTLVSEYARDGGPLEGLSNEILAGFGRRVDETFYPGLAAMLDDLQSLASATRDVHVEFYIISGGLKELLEGSQLVRERFAGVYASQLGEDPSTGRLTRLKRVVTFTEKTRYLFEINKGIEPAESLANPYLVNQEVRREDRRVPFENIVYVGDGLTDIPCFSLLKASGGTPFGVFDPGREDQRSERSYSSCCPTVSSACTRRSTAQPMSLVHSYAQRSRRRSPIRRSGRLRPDRIMSLLQKPRSAGKG